MRRTILAAIAGIGLAGFASAGANAMPVAPQQPASPLVQHVAEALPAALQGVFHYGVAALCAALVIAIGMLLRRRSDRAVAREQAAAVGRAEADVLGG